MFVEENYVWLTKPARVFDCVIVFYVINCVKTNEKIDIGHLLLLLLRQIAYR